MKEELRTAVCRMTAVLVIVEVVPINVESGGSVVDLDPSSDEFL